MPPTLHPHLKRGLDFDDLHIDPKDAIEHGPVERLGPEEQAAKRRRIGKIALQALQGRRPVILSAGLRGPFNNGWKNPWATGRRAARSTSERQGGVRDQKDGKHPSSAKSIEPTRAKKRARSTARKTLQTLETLKTQSIASPEASRAANEDLENTYTLEEIELPPPTAPLPDEHDTSGATEYFRVETEERVQRRSPLTNPFWLRRPGSAGDFNMKPSANGGAQLSPTRSRNGPQKPDATRRLQLAVPKAPLGSQARSARTALPCDINSSTSASMVISPSAKSFAPTPNEKARPSAIRTAKPRLAVGDAHSTSFPAQPAPPQSTALAQTVAPTTTERGSPAKHIPNTQSRSQGRPLREDIQRSAERLVDSGNLFSASKSQPQKANTKAVAAEVTLRPPQHDLVTSPGPNSSTGFVYKKVGGTKWTIDNAPRSKPRAVNFNSSPAVKTSTPRPAQSSPHSAKESIVAASSKESVAVASNVSPADTEESSPQHDTLQEEVQTGENDREQQSLRSSRSSQTSVYSTQAAMLLAQLEFQESTFPTSSSGTLRPWSQPQDNTPRPILPELSPAITPLSVFRPQLEQHQSLNSMLRGPPISTQDLFAAASPFAFSTVKKRAEAPY